MICVQILSDPNLQFNNIFQNIEFFCPTVVATIRLFCLITGSGTAVVGLLTVNYTVLVKLIRRFL